MLLQYMQWLGRYILITMLVSVDDDNEIASFLSYTVYSIYPFFTFYNDNGNNYDSDASNSDDNDVYLPSPHVW